MGQEAKAQEAINEMDFGFSSMEWPNSKKEALAGVTVQAHQTQWVA